MTQTRQHRDRRKVPEAILPSAAVAAFSPQRLRRPLPIEPLLSQADLCRVLATSQRSIDRLRSSGRLPPPDLAIGRSPRWRASTIRSWIDRGGR